MREIIFGGSDGWPLHAVVSEPPERAGMPLVMLHGGGPDHRSLLPLAVRLARRRQVALPDIRGYGRSICRDPAAHCWNRYGGDVAALLDALGLPAAAVLGTGLGATIALRFALDRPDRVRTLVLVSVEDIEEEEDAKEAEQAMLDTFAARVLAEGLEAAWASVLDMFPPVVGQLVRDAIPRSDPASIAAAAAIGRDRAFHGPGELAAIVVPTLIVPGADARHPAALARQLAGIMPEARLAASAMNPSMRTAEDLAAAIAQEAEAFLNATS